MNGLWQNFALTCGAIAGLVPALTLLMNRQLNKSNAEKTDADREDVLETARRKAQETALESAAAAYQNVERRCISCEKRLESMEAKLADRDKTISGLRETNSALLDAFTEVLPLLPGNSAETQAARAAIQKARRTRYSAT